MALLNNFIKVQELTDDLIIGEVLKKYDSTSPFVIGQIVDLDKDTLARLLNKGLSTHDIYNGVAVFRRVTKITSFDALCIQEQDLIEIMPKETYNKYVYKSDNVSQA